MGVEEKSAGPTPLSHITVLDLSRVLAGRWAGQVCPAIATPPPRLGEANAQILDGRLGIGPDELEALAVGGVI